MDINVKTSPLYGSTLYRASLPDFKAHEQSLLSAVYELYEQEKGLSRSNQGGWQSGDRLFTNEHPEFRWLTSAIKFVGKECIRHGEGDNLHGDIHLGATWVNINPTGAWNAPHTHMPCEWVGVCYLKTNESPIKRGKKSGPAEGNIMFFDPVPLGPQYRGNRPIFQHFSPQIGEFFVFPGFMLHMVAPHMEKEDRVSVAFNFRLVQNLLREQQGKSAKKTGKQ